MFMVLADILYLIEPFKPQYQHVCSPHCCPYIYYYSTSWESCLKGHSHAILVHFKNKKKICPHINERPQIMV